jgi:hypothetical protein
VRALIRQATAELRDKLVAAIASGEYSLEQQLDRVFDAFRGGLAQRLAWLTAVDPGGGPEEAQTIMRDIATPGGSPPPRRAPRSTAAIPTA